MLARYRHRASPSLLLLSAFLVAMLFVAVSAGAQDRTDRIAFGVGSFGVLDTPRSAELGVELRFAPRAFGLRPVVGGAINSDQGGYLLGGLRRDFNAGERWIVTPHFGVTLFDEGDGKDLGHVIEFRSGLELAYRLGERSRLGISFYHLSNAGLADTNPGSESLVLVYSFR
jgi:lipid A 3-O-deacylase